MTEIVVLDASAAIACVAPDENPPSEIRQAVSSQALVAPAMWPFEVYNVLLMLRRKARMTEADYAIALETVGIWRVELDAALIERIRNEVMAMAGEHGLTVYDAAYLELAHRRKLPLATLDDDLRKAARKAKVKLL